MNSPEQILKQYWNYDSFRPLQRDIIGAVLEKKDVLALLPTGGGKSVCYQVPGLVLDGLCIVISPLIALMKDQVEQLVNRGIAAAAVHSGLSFREIDNTLDRAMVGKLKFLYLSPERLKTDIFLARFSNMPVNFLAVDEAHCISQWGYDFRPSYFDIYKLREIKPDLPVMALTATATLKVRQDIVEKLQLKSPSIFVKSFARNNLHYVVRKVEGKESKLIEVLRAIKGSGLVYARSRKGTKEIADFLRRKGISADYYNAGLSTAERSRKQEDWIANRTQIMVATNAFGMGIDKPDVRLVVHWDLPDSPEAYYQEAGRAGRDEKNAFAVLLVQEKDYLELKEWKLRAWPDEKTIRKVYQCLANYFSIALGSHELSGFEFNLEGFSKNYKLSGIDVYHALKKLEEEGYLLLTDGFHQPSKLMFAIDQVRLYEYQIANARFEPLIKQLMRIYGGELFNNYIRISEEKLAKNTFNPVANIVSQLEQMEKNGIVFYEKRSDAPKVIFTLARQDAQTMPLDMKRMAARKQADLDRLEAMIAYAEENYLCRSLRLQHYFGEQSLEPCGTCDLCRSRKTDSSFPAEKFKKRLLEKLKEGAIPPQAILLNFGPERQAAALSVIRQCIDEQLIAYLEDGSLGLK
jgi:ATP-dependent DNA helicase RecQ